MGTSLSGLTPATTFDGLLKVGDNDPLTADLKAISTGDGTDTILSLSTGALQIGGATTIVGVDNDYNTVGFEIQRSDSQYIFRARNRGAIQMGSGIDWIEMNSNNNGIRLKTSNVERARITEIGLGIGETTPTSRLHVKGSGATSATTSLLVQNSAGADVLQTLDNGSVGVGGPANSSYRVTMTSGVLRLKDLLFGQTGSNAINNTSLLTMKWNGSTGIGISGGGAIDATARLHVKGSGNTNTTTSLLVQNSDGTDGLYVKDALEWGIGYGNTNKIDGNNNNLYIRHNQLFFMTGGNYFAKLTTAGFQVGNGAGTPTARLQVKGSGTTSATTALLVQNSAGTELFKVNDSGATNITANITNAVLGSFRNTDANGFGIELRAGNATSRYSMQWERYSGGGGGRLYPDGVMIGDQVAPTARLQVKGSGNDATTTALLVQNSDGVDMLKVTDDAKVSIDAIKLSNIKAVNSDLRFDIGGTGTIKVVSDKVAIGGNTTPTARLQVKGSGATSATTALLVQNSAGTDLLKVRDDGVTTANSLSVSDYLLLGQMVLRYDTIYRGNNASGVLQVQNDSLSFSSTSGVTNDASAMFQLESTTKGFLPPRMTDAERDAIATPAAGLMIYDTTNNQMNYWNGSTWIAF